MNTIETIDAISRCNDNCSDYRVAKLLGVTRQTVSKYRIGKVYMSEEARMRAAELLNEDPIVQLVHGRMERAKCSDVRNVWQRSLETLTRAGAALVLAFVLIGTPATVDASEPELREQCILC